MSRKKLTVAVLGCGSIGQRHIRNLLIIEKNIEIYAYDPKLGRNSPDSKDPRIRYARRIKDVWDHKPQIAFITSPTNLHLVQAIEAAQHGCHLFVEKPLSYKLAGTRILEREVRRRKLITMVGCNMRFHPGPEKVKKIIDSGMIGRILSARIHTGSHLPSWRPGSIYRRSYSASPVHGGAILDCIHEIDLSLWFFGKAKLLFSAVQKANSIGLKADGLAEILLKHQNGVLTNLHLNFVQQNYDRGCVVIGSKGTVYWDFNKRAIEVWSGNKLKNRFAEPRDWELNHMYIKEVKYFLDHVTGRKLTMNGIGKSVKALEIAIAARRKGI